MIIDFKQFLSKQKSLIDVTQHRIVYFKIITTSPVLFFSWLRERWPTNLSIETINLDENYATIDSLRPRLESTFLGMQTYFWFSSYQLLSPSEKGAFVNYLQTYQGPNIIIVIADEQLGLPVSAEVLCIEIPELIDLALMQHLISWFPKRLGTYGTDLINKIFKKYERISLDAACMSLHYALVIGSTSDELMHEVIAQLITTEQSLFTLSSYFFAKNGRAFFALWQLVEAQYSDVFWISYWSELLWRSACFVKLSSEKKNYRSKKDWLSVAFFFFTKRLEKIYGARIECCA